MEPNDGLNNKQNETEETVITSSTNEAIISSTEMSQPVAQASADNDDFQGKPKKKSHAMVIGMVFLAILAIGGIGFGIWAWTTGFAQSMKHEEEIMDLRSQLAEATRPVVEEYDIEDDEIEEDYEEKNEDVDTEDYIYVGEWGMKIKIPEGLKQVSYDYIRNSNGPAVVVVGANYNGGSVPEGVIEDLGIIGLGSIQRYTKGGNNSANFTSDLCFLG